MKYIHCGIIQLNRVQTQIHQGLLSKLFSVKSLDFNWIGGMDFHPRKA
jgi:hypothetical protein